MTPVLRKFYSYTEALNTPFYDHAELIKLALALNEEEQKEINKASK